MTAQMKKTVVTGGAGFIGSHLVDALLDNGGDVVVVDDFSTGLASNLEGARERHGARLRILNDSILSPAAADMFESFRPDTVFHQAAQANVRWSVADPINDANRNILGTIQLLENSRKVGVKQFIFASTGGAIYGEQDSFPADESHRTRPECPYGISKRGAELYLEYYGRYHPMRTVAMRYSNVYGPRQNPKGEAGVVAIFCERLRGGSDLVVNGDGEQTRDFVFVGDVVAANLAVASLPFSPGFEVFNVGTGEETSVNQVAQILKSATQNVAGFAHAQRDVRRHEGLPGEQRRSVITSAKLQSATLQSAIPWKPAVPISIGLEKTLRSYA